MKRDDLIKLLLEYPPQSEFFTCVESEPYGHKEEIDSFSITRIEKGKEEYYL